jgi:nanoRNase/pAp phosphatase (c-di-AMP/oligoRNAs hydrolase)
MCQIIHINSRFDRLADLLEKRKANHAKKEAHTLKIVTVKEENRSNKFRNTQGQRRKIVLIHHSEPTEYRAAFSVQVIRAQ